MRSWLEDSLLHRAGSFLLRTLIPKPVRLAFFKARHAEEPAFVCPLCGYEGPFRSYHNLPGGRRYARCPDCGAFERHRLMYLAYRDATQGRDLSALSVIHFAPEPYMGRILQQDFGAYTTADLYMDNVDHKADLADLPFPDASFDAVMVAHVLVLIEDDRQALREVHRILRPGGLAFLAEPMIAPATVEYGSAQENTGGYLLRAPGPDYYDRHRDIFARVETYQTSDFPEHHQLYVYEDRTPWPTPEMPKRPPMPGERHIDMMAVCYK